MGVGGEAAAGRLLDAGRRVAVIERELIGGECAYWACIPSKTLLRAPEARAEASRAAGVATPAIDWPGLRDYHDYMVRHLDDSAQVKDYEQAGATVIKGPTRLARRWRAWTRFRCGPTGKPPTSATSPPGCCWSAAARSASKWASSTP